MTIPDPTMHAALYERTNAHAYIDTVLSACAAMDLEVSSRTLSDDNGLRQAELTLERDPEEYAWPAADRFRVRWTEEEGWSLTPIYSDRDERLPPLPDEGPWRMGAGVVPDPVRIANWLAVVTTMPQMSLGYDHEPYRSCGNPDPALETALTRYVADTRS